MLLLQVLPSPHFSSRLLVIPLLFVRSLAGWVPTLSRVLKPEITNSMLPAIHTKIVTSSHGLGGSASSVTRDISNLIGEETAAVVASSEAGCVSCEVLLSY